MRQAQQKYLQVLPLLAVDSSYCPAVHSDQSLVSLLLTGFSGWRYSFLLYGLEGLQGPCDGSATSCLPVTGLYMGLLSVAATATTWSRMASPLLCPMLLVCLHVFLFHGHFPLSLPPLCIWAKPLCKRKSLFLISLPLWPPDCQSRFDFLWSNWTDLIFYYYATDRMWLDWLSLLIRFQFSNHWKCLDLLCGSGSQTF